MPCLTSTDRLALEAQFLKPREELCQYLGHDIVGQPATGGRVDCGAPFMRELLKWALFVCPPARLPLGCCASIYIALEVPTFLASATNMTSRKKGPHSSCIEFPPNPPVAHKARTICSCSFGCADSQCMHGLQRTTTVQNSFCPARMLTQKPSCVQMVEAASILSEHQPQITT